MEKPTTNDADDAGPTINIGGVPLLIFHARAQRAGSMRVGCRNHGGYLR